MKPFAVYLHTNGNLVIWGYFEHFESSAFVEKVWKVDYDLAKAPWFREVVEMFNAQNQTIINLKKTLELKNKATVLLEENHQLFKTDALIRIMNMSKWERSKYANIRGTFEEVEK